MSKVFFTNSGTEAIEGAIKVARKYAWLKDGSNDHEIIAMQHSFHGRSLGALAVTGNAHYQEPFKPLIGGIKFAQYNDCLLYTSCQQLCKSRGLESERKLYRDIFCWWINFKPVSYTHLRI